MKKYIHLIPCLLACISYGMGLRSRQQMKEALMIPFLKGQSVESIQSRAEVFACNGLDRFIKSEALARFHWHLEKSHHCVLISANLDLYLEPWAKRVGFHNVITSRCEKTIDGHLTGYLEGPNCRGSEKVRRLEELLGSKKKYTLYAYGDSAGDAELLALADYPFYRKFR